MDKLKRALSGDDSQAEEESGIIPQFMDATTLSWSTRIKGFVICFLIGVFFSLLGSLCLFLGKGLVTFGILYTMGNVVSMLSTCFLMGPVNQVKKMFAPTRVIATVLVFVMFGLTLFAAFYLKNSGLVLLFIICQWIALTWYSLSYIPYARDACKKCMTTCIA